MSSNTRWLVLAYAISSLICTYLLNMIVESGMALAGIDDPLGNVVPLASIIGLVGGIICFVVMLKHPRVNEFGGDVVKETRKVSWPTVPETRAATLVVIVLVIIITAILGVFDYIFATLSNLIYS